MNFKILFPSDNNVKTVFQRVIWRSIHLSPQVFWCFNIVSDAKSYISGALVSILQDVLYV